MIARAGLSARRSLGQHFLLDRNLAARIVREAEPLAGRHVIEIGPGPGGLTRALLESEAADVTAVEVDPRFVAALAELERAAAGRLSVVAQDALTTDVAALAPPPRQIVANLPFNVGTPLLIGWLRGADAFERLTLMFQEEVAERICATPGGGAYGRLSVLAQWICEAGIRLRVPPEAFTPRPKVWSAVVRLTPRPDRPDSRLLGAMERVTAAAFGKRRKMLRGALAALGGAALLARAGIAEERRAETLSVGEFERLARLLAAGQG